MLLSHVHHVSSETRVSDYFQGDIGTPYAGQPQHWYIACPICSGKFSLRGHVTVEHDDGTVTVTPSLLCTGSERLPCSAHYFINRNVISWVS